MLSSELVDYVHEQTRQGVSAKDLRVSLMEAGWLESDINNALHDVAAGLHPVTPGASIHEDLAQVRTVVASLATRVHSIEAALASVGALPMQEQISSGTLGPDHEIAAAPKRHWFVRAAALVGLVVLFGYIGSYASALVARNALAPLDQIIIAAAVGALVLVGAVVAMRSRRSWAATVLTASAVTFWGMDALIAWRVYAYMETMTAAALGAFLVVIAVVMGTWIRRYSAR